MISTDSGDGVAHLILPCAGGRRFLWNENEIRAGATNEI